MDNSIVLEQIIRNATVAIDQVVYSEGEIYLPGLYRYIVDEKTGKIIQCPND